MKLLKKMVLIILMGLLSTNIYAVEICVTDSAGLIFALAIADSNNQDDVIKLAAGNYDSPTGGFEYDGASEAFDLSISGGWTEFFGNTCGQQLVGMFESTIDGNNTKKGMTILSNDASLVSITRISFVSGKDEFGSGGGLLVADGSLLLEHNVFLANSAGFDGAAFWYSSGGFSHVIRNNVFVNNTALITGGAIYINIESGANGVYFTNNTVINNNTNSVNTDVSSGLNIRTFGSVQAYVGNNIFWNNQYNGLELFGTGMKYVRHNDIDSQTGQVADSAFGNVSVDPLFQPDKGDLSLQLNSPLVDAGIKANQVTNDFPNNWFLGNFDIGGADRNQGPKVDIGAYEVTPEVPIFMNGFE